MADQTSHGTNTMALFRFHATPEQSRPPYFHKENARYAR